MTIRIIACNIFREVLKNLDPPGHLEGMKISYIPSHLHLRPVALKKRVLEHIHAAHGNGEQIGCLFGRCFEGIDDVLEEEGD